MKDFKKRFDGGSGSGFRGGNSGGGFRGGPRQDFSHPKEMHQATCARCNKVCEVPFKPNGKKPVFCKDCFASGKPDVPGRDFSRGDSPVRPSLRPEGGERRGDDLKPQIEMLNTKLDTLIRMVKALEHVPAEIPEVKSAAKVAAKTPAKAAARKAVKKTAKKK